MYHFPVQLPDGTPAEAVTSEAPPLMGITEVTLSLNLSRRRISQLRQTDPRFPAPIAELACGPIWARPDIVAYSEIPRPAGRPRKSEEYVQ